MGRRLYQGANTLKIFRRVDASGSMVGFNDANADAVGERAQLLERLDNLEGRGGHRGYFQERVTPIHIKPHMRARRGRKSGAARKRNGGAGEVEGVPAIVGDNLDHIGIAKFIGVGKGAAERAHLDGRVGQERRNGSIDGVGLDQRLIALQVDDGTAGVGSHHLRDSIGAAHVVDARHDRGAAETAHGARDALVVGGHDYGVHQTRRGRAAIHVLDHRAAGDRGKNFSGETGRLEPRGDDGEDRRFSQRKWQTLDRTGVHDESYHSEIARMTLEMSPTSVGRFLATAAATGWLITGSVKQDAPEVREPRVSGAPPTVTNTVIPAHFTEKLRDRLNDSVVPNRGRNPFRYGARHAPTPRDDAAAPAESGSAPPPAPEQPPLPVFKLSGIAASQQDSVSVLTAIVIDNGAMVFAKTGDKLSNGYSVLRVDETSITLVDAAGVTQTLRLP